MLIGSLIFTRSRASLPATTRTMAGTRVRRWSWRAHPMRLPALRICPRSLKSAEVANDGLFGMAEKLHPSRELAGRITASPSIRYFAGTLPTSSRAPRPTWRALLCRNPLL